MNIHDASFKALKAFDRAPGSVKKRDQAQPLSQTQRDAFTRQVRDELSAAQTSCGSDQHRKTHGPNSETFERTPYIRFSSSTSRSSETWTNNDKNAFVQVKDQVTSSDSEGFSLSGARVHDSCGFRRNQDTSYGVETSGYIAGMKISDNNGYKTATAFKVDKRNPESSWMQEWNIR